MPQEPFLRTIESEPIIDGRFTNIKRIDADGGNGYFSLLFTADDQETGKKVALKFYDPTKSNHEREERFIREGDMLYNFSDDEYVIDCIGKGVRIFTKKLIDPNTNLVIPIPYKFIAMELADGSVEDFIYSGNPNPTPLERLKCFKELIKAVFRLHSRNVCHRDLKPSNFLLCSGCIKVSDLGTAKDLKEYHNNITQAYIFPVGDLRYSAPELFLSVGIADEISFKADIFSLGAILFELFTMTILSTQIFTNRDQMNLLDQIGKILSVTKKEDKINNFRVIAKQLEGKLVLPDINGYNHCVPKCILNHINTLYKNLSHINPYKRLYNSVSIHRTLDICIKTLENEIKYQRLIANKREKKELSQRKSEKRMENQ